MTLRLLLSGAVVAALFACRSHRAYEPSARSQRTSDAPAASVVAQPAAPSTPDSLASDTTGCSFVALQLHPQPRELVDEFLSRDAEGEFLSPGDWYFSALMCGGKGGTDRAMLITSYQVDSLGVRPDTVRYRVTYAVRGSLDQDANGGFISPGVQQMADTFVVVRTAFGWRIAAPANPIPHLLPEVARRKWSLSRGQDSVYLDSLSRLKRKAGA